MRCWRRHAGLYEQCLATVRVESRHVDARHVGGAGEQAALAEKPCADTHIQDPRALRAVGILALEVTDAGTDRLVVARVPVTVVQHGKEVSARATRRELPGTGSDSITAVTPSALGHPAFGRPVRAARCPVILRVHRMALAGAAASVRVMTRDAEARGRDLHSDQTYVIRTGKRGGAGRDEDKIAPKSSKKE